MNKESINLFSAEEVNLTKEKFDVSSRHSFVLIFVKSGMGYVEVEEGKFKIGAGKLFFLNTTRTCYFSVEKATLIIIRCPLNFIDKIRAEADRIETCDNLHKLNYIANNFHSQAGCVFRDPNDLNFATCLIDNIVREYNTTQNGDLLIIRQSIAILLNLIARNLIKSDTKDLEMNQSEFLVMRIVSYVQQNIKELELIKINEISKHFGLSKNYFGEFFKKNVGSSYQSYLLAYRLDLVATRLQYSTARLKEIASELNFSDESHLSKIFKKHRGMSPTEYRNRHNR